MLHYGVSRHLVSMFAHKGLDNSTYCINYKSCSEAMHEPCTLFEEALTQHV